MPAKSLLLTTGVVVRPLRLSVIAESTHTDFPQLCKARVKTNLQRSFAMTRDTRPNFLVIVADDLGQQAFSWFILTLS